jgi:hypothetical protein
VSEAEELLAEVVLEQIHQLLVEVKDFLEEGSPDPKKRLKLAGKIELTLENWNDDAFFEGGTREADLDATDGGDILEQLAESGLDEDEGD